MDAKLASGDNNVETDNMDKTTGQVEEKHLTADDTKLVKEENNIVPSDEENYEIEVVDEKDLNLQERIANCKKIIESLKLELTEEKAKLEEESKSSEILLTNSAYVNSTGCYTSTVSPSSKIVNDTLQQSDTNYLYTCSVDTKLLYDDNLIEYEKQLQRYQDTLTMAQAEKKNAIRKQMLAKVYKLKLLEVENQCNIELLRVKQSLQCLEPLQMIANKWKNSENNPDCDLNNYELIPGYSELSTLTNDVSIFTDDEKSEFVAFNEDS